MCYHVLTVKRYRNFLPYAVLVIGFALRLYRLGASSLWYDETVSVYLAQSDLAELIRHTAGDIHPPFYYLLLHFWGRAAGWSEFAMAFASLWFGVLLIAIACRVARVWTPFHLRDGRGAEWAGMTAALLVALSPFNVWYSQEVRMYTLGATLGLLSVFFLRRLLSNGGSARHFVAYVVVTVLGLYTLYYFVFLILFEWLWVGYRVWRSAYGEAHFAKRESQTDFRFVIPFLLAQFAIVVLYLPWLPIAFRQVTDPPVPPWRDFIGLPRVLAETLSALTFGQAVDAKVFGPVAALLTVPIGALLWREWKGRQNAVSGNGSQAKGSPPSSYFLLGYFLIPLVVIFLASLWKPLYHMRYMFTYSPAFYILGAYALVNLAGEFQNARRGYSARRAYGTGALTLVVGLGFVGIMGLSLDNFWHNPQYAKDDLRGAVNFIAERWRPGDVILVNAGYAYPAVTYYFPQALTRERLVNFRTPSGNTPLLLTTGSIDGSKNLGWGDARSDFYATTADETQAALDRVFGAYSRVWILRIYDTVVDPTGVIRSYLDEHAIPLEDAGFSGESQARVQGFLTLTTHELPSGATRLDRSLGDRVELVGYEIDARQVKHGAFLDAVLYWRLLQAVNYNYQVTLQLLNGNGENVAQYDEKPLGELLPMTRWKVAPSERAGELYREPLRLKIPETLAPGDYRAIVKLYEPRSGQVVGEVVDLGTVQVR